MGVILDRRRTQGESHIQCNVNQEVDLTWIRAWSVSHYLTLNGNPKSKPKSNT